MIFNKRILKTGALAVAAAAAFGLFAYRAAEWSRGLNSGFVVFGQTSTGGGGGTTGTASTVTKIIPQVAVGDFGGGANYSTIIQIVNPNSTGVTLNANFYKENGAASTLTLGSNLNTAPTFTGSLTSINLAPNQVLVISGGTTAATTPSTGTINWGKISTTGTVSIATFFELRDNVTKVLASRVGVAASPADMASFVIPRPHNVATGLDVAFALVNTGSADATYTATLKDASGNTLQTLANQTLQAAHHVALFTPQFFYPPSGAEPALPTGTNYHYIVFTSSSSSFAAIALAFEGGNQTSFPVDRLQ